MNYSVDHYATFIYFLFLNDYITGSSKQDSNQWSPLKLTEVTDIGGQHVQFKCSRPLVEIGILCSPG